MSSSRTLKLVVEALTALKDPIGSSVVAISTWIQHNNNYNNKKTSMRSITAALKMGVTVGTLRPVPLGSNASSSSCRYQLNRLMIVEGATQEHQARTKSTTSAASLGALPSKAPGAEMPATQPQHKENDRGLDPAAKVHSKDRKILKLQMTTITNSAKPASASAWGIFSIDLVASEIFDYLGVRDLFAVSKTSKFLRHKIQLKHIIRSALFHGGTPKQSLDRLLPLIKARQIFTPSPLRLLRIVNGKRCENCNAARSSLVSREHGVFFCREHCANNNYYTRKVDRYSEKWSRFLDHPRVFSDDIEKTKVRIFHRPYRESATGERVGPLLTATDRDQVVTDQTSLEDLLRQRYHEDVFADKADEIITIYEGTVEEAKSWLVRKSQQQQEARRDHLQRKRENISALLNALSEQIGDASWKDRALAVRHQDPIPACRRSWQRFPAVPASTKFDVPFVHDLLIEYANAPSKVTKTKIKELATILREAFDPMDENDIGGNFNFV